MGEITKTTANITIKKQDGTTAKKTLTNINPDCTDRQIYYNTRILYGLTKNEVKKITKTQELDVDYEGGESISVAGQTDFYVDNKLDMTIIGGTDSAKGVAGTIDADFSYASLSTGTDTIYSSGSNNSINGGANNDTIYSSGSNNKLDGSAGTDTIYSSGSNNTIDGGAQNDTIYITDTGSVGSTLIFDTINNGNDSIYGLDTDKDVFYFGVEPAVTVLPAVTGKTSFQYFTRETLAASTIVIADREIDSIKYKVGNDPEIKVYVFNEQGVMKLDEILNFISPNWGAIEIICCVLVFKGIGTLKELTDSIKEISQIIQKMQLQNSLNETKLNSINERVTHVEYLLRGYPPPDVIDYPRSNHTN